VAVKTLATVTWHDAFTDTGPPTRLPVYVPAERVSVGYLVCNDAKAIGLAQTYDIDLEGQIAYQDVLWIPRTMRPKVKRL
jgi:hypothetical protein